jgi:hypothetical protein
MLKEYRESKSIYQNNILKVQKTANKEDFLLFIARTEKNVWNDTLV